MHLAITLPAAMSPRTPRSSSVVIFTPPLELIVRDNVRCRAEPATALQGAAVLRLPPSQLLIALAEFKYATGEIIHEAAAAHGLQRERWHGCCVNIIVGDMSVSNDGVVCTCCNALRRAWSLIEESILRT